MRLPTATEAALLLTALGEVDGSTINRLAQHGATRALASLVELEFGNTAASAVIDGAPAASPETEVIARLAAYERSGFASDLRHAVDLIAREDSPFALRVLAYAATQLNDVRLIDRLLDQQSGLPEGVRIRLLSKVAPGRAADLALRRLSEQPSTTTRTDAAHALVAVGATDLAWSCLGDMEDNEALEGEPLIRRLMAMTAPEELAGRLLAPWSLPDLPVGAAVIGFDWNSNDSIVWSVADMTTARSGVLDARPVLAALNDLSDWIPLSGEPRTLLARRFFAWRDRFTEFESALRALSTALLSSEVHDALEALAPTTLVVSLPPELVLVPFDSLLLEQTPLWRKFDLWHVSPAKTQRLDGVAPVDLVLLGDGVRSPLTIDGVATVDLASGELPPDRDVRTVLFHGHGNAGRGRRSRMNSHWHSGALIGGEVVAFESLLPSSIEGLIALCCEGVGHHDRSDGVRSGITADAFASGATWVLSAPWLIPDDPVSAELGRVLIGLLDGHEPAAAVRQVRERAFDLGDSVDEGDDAQAVARWLGSAWRLFGMPATAGPSTGSSDVGSVN